MSLSQLWWKPPQNSTLPQEAKLSCWSKPAQMFPADGCPSRRLSCRCPALWYPVELARRAPTGFQAQRLGATDHSKINLSCLLFRLIVLGYCLEVPSKQPTEHSSETAALTAPVVGAQLVSTARGLPTSPQIHRGESGNAWVAEKDEVSGSDFS